MYDVQHTQLHIQPGVISIIHIKNIKSTVQDWQLALKGGCRAVGVIVHFGYLIDECFPNDSRVFEHRSLTEFQGDSTQGSSESKSLVTTSSNHFRTEG